MSNSRVHSLFLCFCPCSCGANAASLSHRAPLVHSEHTWLCPAVKELFLNIQILFPSSSSLGGSHLQLSLVVARGTGHLFLYPQGDSSFQAGFVEGRTHSFTAGPEKLRDTACPSHPLLMERMGNSTKHCSLGHLPEREKRRCLLSTRGTRTALSDASCLCVCRRVGSSQALVTWSLRMQRMENCKRWTFL